MTRPRFSFRPNLQNEEHRRAWDSLLAVPEGQRNAFLVRAILKADQEETLKNTLRQVIREELRAVPSQPGKEQEESVPQQMLGFLGSLLGDE